MTNATKAGIIAAVNVLLGLAIVFHIVLTQVQIGAVDTGVTALLGLWVLLTHKSSKKRIPDGTVAIATPEAISALKQVTINQHFAAAPPTATPAPVADVAAVPVVTAADVVSPADVAGANAGATEQAGNFIPLVTPSV